MMILTIIAAIIGAVFILANIEFFLKLALVGVALAAAFGALIVTNVLFF